MEIISYVGNRCGTQKRKVFLPKKVYMPQYTEERGERHFYLHIFLKHMGKMLWTVPVILALIFAPYMLYKAYVYFQNYTSPLDLDVSIQQELQNLDEAMLRFATSHVEEFDADGNVNLSGDSQFTYEDVFQDVVTFKTYTVKSGDTISGITKKFGLNNISTIIAVNDISNVRQVFSGQKLKVPSCDGLFHTVVSGNTLESISVKYGVTVEALLDANDLDTYTLTAGQKIFIPGAKLGRNALRLAMGEVWKVPLPGKWRLTSKFGVRGDPFTGTTQRHNGLDMAIALGTPVYASQGGRVKVSGWNNLYGNYVIIDHGNGYQSLYGHMSKRNCKAGDYVNQGVIIGLVGSTGYSTGPHLHFTIYKNGKVIDPLPLIK